MENEEEPGLLLEPTSTRGNFGKVDISVEYNALMSTFVVYD